MLKYPKVLLAAMTLVVLLVGPVSADCPTGDLNRNCKVDFKDVELFAEQWLADSNNSADFTGSNGVNIVDFSLLAENWGAEGTSLVISEFMASNDRTLEDEDDEACDWIEIHNPTSEFINLGDWYLTDDVNDLMKWEFPAVEIASDEYKLVFASGKNRRDPESELHTNFELQAGGEFLALVYPDGETIAHSYDEYPPEFVDISYGLSDNAGLSIDTVLVPEYSPAKALIPADGTLGLSWTEVGFSDSGWKSGTTGVGYDTQDNYNYLINLNVGEMQNVNETVYMRIPFEITELVNFDTLTLYIKRDDGFATYLNGHLIPEASALANVGNLSWNSGATGNCSDAAAHNFEPHDITAQKNLLRVGDNVLAIHGLNWRTSSSDMLILPKLVGSRAEVIDVNSVLEGYFMAPSPGRVNGGTMANLGPAIYNVTKDPPRPANNEAVSITAKVRETFNPVKSVTLHYRVMYGGESAVAMYDDGTHGDGEAGDGVYGAAISSRTLGAGEMVRWYVTSEDTENQTSRNPLFPYPDNSPEYYGTVTANPSMDTQMALMEWFVQNVGASETTGGTRCSLYYNGEFYDNIEIHIRGGSTQNKPKKHFKFLFNRGYKFRYSPDAPRVNEFNLNSTYSDKAYIRQNLAFEGYDWCGCPGSESFPVRAQRNGQFHGVLVFIEEPEEELLEREGLDPDGALYKMYNTFNVGDRAEKKTRRWEGRSDLDSFCSGINNTSGTTLHNNIFDQVNLPLTLNYLAATVLVHQNDHPHKNHYLYRDSDGSGEWLFMPWDNDLSWGSNWTGSSYHDYIYAADDQVPGRATDVKPSHPFIGRADCKEWNNHWNKLINALLNDSSVREMFRRRLRTVMDEFLKPPGTPYSELFIEQRVNELAAQMGPEVALDYAKWADPWDWGGQGGYIRDQSFSYAISVLKNNYVGVRRTHLFVTHNVDNAGAYPIANSFSAEIPNAQPANATINFGSYEYNPASRNQDEEYIELINPNAYAVDISGWRFTGGVEHTFLPGTVIVVGGSLYVSPNSAAFRTRSTSPRGGQGRFVQGNYKGHLSSWGETVELVNKQGVVVDTFSYPGNPSDQQRYLRITEIMYHPAHGGAYNEEEYEYIELKNIGAGALLLDEVKLTKGIYYEFAAGGNLYLGPGDYIIIVKNRGAFASRYDTGDMNIAPGAYTGSLGNAGEKIKLEDSTNSTILEFDYDDDWYKITDEEGFSLTIRDVSNAELDSWDEKNCWRSSAYAGGSPGWDDGGILPDPGAVVINEVLAHSEAADWIELHNTTGAEIDIGGWYLSDSTSVLKKYRIADGTKIDANEYLVFYEDGNFGEAGADAGRLIGFALSENGEQVCLSSGEGDILTGYRDVEDFGPSATGPLWAGLSFGRYFKRSTGNYNFVAMSAATPCLPNAYPKVGPIVISEIMYNPQSSDQRQEYIELHNIGAVDVPLYDSDADEPWKFTDGIEYTFPAVRGIVIPAGGRLLVVKDMTAYLAQYGIPPFDVPILGPYSGKLSNGGEKVELSKPGDVDTPGTRYYIRVDRVNYSDGSHPQDCPGGVDLWPVEADAGGYSLTRIWPELYGNDPNNWTAATPSPGE